MAEPKSIQVPLLDLTPQHAVVRDAVLAAIQRVIESQHFILGPEVRAIETEVAEYSGCKFGIGVSSGTDAILLALMAIDFKPGDEVITTPYTFFATAGAAARLGGKAVFVDIDPLTYNIDPRGIEAAVTKRTRAIIPVHLYDQMAAMDGIVQTAERYNLYVIEDAAQAIGSEYKGRRAGSFGHFGCFSFYPTKNLGGFGDGGMITTNDEELADRVRLLRNHGHRPKYFNRAVGGNFRLDEIQAAVLRVKLKYLEQWTKLRRLNALYYRELFNEVGLESLLPVEAAGGRHVYHQFVIRSHRRDELIAFLRQRGISTEVYYPVPMHLQECFAEWGYKVGDFPESESAAAETLALPIYPGLTEEMLTSAVSAVKDFYIN